MKSKLFFIILFLGSCSFSQTMGFYLRDQVKVLPKSRFIVSVVGFQSNINSQFNSSGENTSIQSKLNRNITFKDITEDDPSRKNQLVGLFSANNVNQAESAGSVQGVVNGFVDGQIPLIGYGLTDDVMIIVAMPILHFRIQAKHQFIKSQVTENFIKNLRDQDQNSTADDFNSAFATSMESKLYRAGYDWNPDVDKKMIGDLQLTFMNQWLENQSAFSFGINLPTATTASMNDVYQLSGGEKKWALTAKYTKEFELNPGLKLTQSLENLFFLPTKQYRRLYLQENAELKEGLDETDVSMVDQLKYQLQLRYEFPQWVGFTGGVSWMYRTGEKLSGSKFDPAVYELNSRSTNQEEKAAYIAMDLNSINSFLAGHFLIPMAFELSAHYTLTGRNVLSEPVYQAQGSLFF